MDSRYICGQNAERMEGRTKMKLLKLLKTFGWRIEYLTEDSVLVSHPEHEEWGVTCYYLDELKQYDDCEVMYFEG